MERIMENEDPLRKIRDPANGPEISCEASIWKSNSKIMRRVRLFPCFWRLFEPGQREENLHSHRDIGGPFLNAIAVMRLVLNEDRRLSKGNHISNVW